MVVGLVGREAVLRSIDASVRAAEAAAAQVVLVEGVSGVGKSALLAAVRDQLPSGPVLETRLDPNAANQRAEALSALVTSAGWESLPEGQGPAVTARWITERIEASGQFTTVIVDDAHWLDDDAPPCSPTWRASPQTSLFSSS